MKTKTLTSVFALAAALMIGSSSQAAVRTWTGSLSSTWNNPSNWVNNSVPFSGDTVVIPSVTRTPTINSSVELRALEIQAGGGLTLNGNLIIINYIWNWGTFTSGAYSSLTLVNPMDIPALTVRDLDLLGSGTYTLSQHVTVTRNFTLRPGGSLELGTRNLTIGGNVTNSGVISSSGSGRVILDATTGTQRIATTSSVCTFDRLTINTARQVRTNVPNLVINKSYQHTGSNLFVLEDASNVWFSAFANLQFPGQGYVTATAYHTGTIYILGDNFSAPVNDLKVASVNNFYLDRPNGVTLGRSMYVRREALLYNGDIRMNGFNLQSGTTYSSTGSLVTVSGTKVTNTDAFGSPLQSGQLRIYGNAAALASSPVRLGYMHHVEIDRPAGVAISQPVYVSGLFNVKNGAVNLGEVNDIIVDLAETGSIRESATGYFTGAGSIAYTKTFNQAVTSIGTLNGGNLGLSIRLTGVTAASSWSFRVIRSGFAYANSGVKRCYLVNMVNATGGFVTRATYTYNINDLNGLNASNLKLYTFRTNDANATVTPVIEPYSINNTVNNNILVVKNFAISGPVTNISFYANESGGFNARMAEEAESVLEAPLSVMAFPNPASGSVTIRTSALGTWQGQMIDMQGREVRQISFQGSDNTIDLSGLSAGNYFITLTGTDAKPIYCRILVQ